MPQRDIPTLLISGDESRFGDSVLKFQNFLVDEANFNPDIIRIIFCTYLGNRYIVEETQMFFDKLKRQGNNGNVVSAYFGHGGKGGFWPSDVSLTYQEWGRLINNDGDFIFINESCYSGSSIPALRQIGLLPKKALVIASSQENEYSYGDLFSDDLIESYRNRQPFRKRKIVVSSIDGEVRVNPNAEMVIIKRESDGIYKKILNPRYIYGVTYRMPKDHTVQHPKRAGKTLDYLLFKS